jgi:hypothetical protein
MSQPDVLVTVEGGVADVQVFKPGLVIEVRDFDTEGVPEDDEMLWTNEQGDRCVRYFVTHDDQQPSENHKAAEQPNTPPLGC